jgi:hypothetical protein
MWLISHCTTAYTGLCTSSWPDAVSQGYKELAKEPYGILGKWVQLELSAALLF